ncbi:Matrix metalloproteinase-21 [Nymphon striatum]|nr:Matrix metalloproteinase-21 [Nymphon striatum]
MSWETWVRFPSEEILKRYGYLKCATKTVKNEELFLELALGLIGLEAFSIPKEKTCTRQEIKAAIKKFQLTYNMRPTGKLDKELLKVMSEARCGNSDDKHHEIIDIPTSKHKETFYNKRPPQPIRRRESKRNRGRNRHKRQFVHSSGLVNGSSSAHSGRRRRELIKEFKMKISSGKIDVLFHKAKKHLTHRKVIKRSTNGGRMSRRKKNLEIITWRLVRSGYSNQLTVVSQKAALTLAFRMWSEIIPLLFVEDNFSPIRDIDIQIAFGKGTHMNCPNNFDGFGGQLGHAIKFRSTGNSQIHVDDDEYYTVGRNSGTNLVKVAVHEVGHALGLLHTSLTHSIMYAIYSKQMANHNFELSEDDRRKVQRMYGSQYWLFDSKSNSIRKGYPRKIQEDFRAPRGVRKPAIPRKIDAAFFNDKDENLYFFKNDQVYAYAVLKGRRGNNVPGFPKKISSMFEAASGSNKPFTSKLDSVYYSYSDSSIYFFKGTRYWKLLGPTYFKKSGNKVAGPWKINSKWKDICDVDIH